MLIRRVDAVVLFVRDRAKCMAFYRDTLGLPVTFSDTHSDGLRLEDQDFVLLDISAAAQMVSEEALALQREVSHTMLLCAGVKDG